MIFPNWLRVDQAPQKSSFALTFALNALALTKIAKLRFSSAFKFGWFATLKRISIHLIRSCFCSLILMTCSNISFCRLIRLTLYSFSILFSVTIWRDNWTSFNNALGGFNSWTFTVWFKMSWFWHLIKLIYLYLNW